MLSTVGQLLPVGLAAAFSTVPIMILLVIMMSSRRQAAAFPFAIGCVVGTVLVVLVAAGVAQLLPAPRPRQEDRVLAIVELILGLALVVLGIRAWRRRRRPRHPRHLPGWATSALESIGPLKAFGVGLLIEFRPKSLLLACVVSLQIHGLPRRAEDLAALLIYVVIATSTVVIPVVLTALSPQRMEPRLAAAAEGLSTSGPLISAVVLLMVGAVVIGSGLHDLA